MAHFKGILLDTGARLVTQNWFLGIKTYPDYISMGSGVFATNTDAEKTVVTELVDPLQIITRIRGREFVEAVDNNRGILRVETEASNQGISQHTAIRELMLYANSEWKLDANGDLVLEPREFMNRPVLDADKNPIMDPVLLTPGIPFAYAWLEGQDVDNVLPVPGIDTGGGQVLTYHYHTMELFVLNHMIPFIEVVVAPGGSVTNSYLNERLLRLIELSNRSIPLSGIRLHKQIFKQVPWPGSP